MMQEDLVLLIYSGQKKYLKSIIYLDWGWMH